MDKTELYGTPAETIARLCKVHIRTARRWKNGERQMPDTARMILSGDLGVFDPAWRGWTVRGGCLISPEGWEIPVNQLRAFPLMLNHLAGYQTEFRRSHADEIATVPRQLTEKEPLLLPPFGVANTGFEETMSDAEHPTLSRPVASSIAPPKIKTQARTGRPPRLSHADERDLYCHRKAGLAIKRCATAFGVSVPTANRIIAKFGAKASSHRPEID